MEYQDYKHDRTFCSFDSLDRWTESVTMQHCWLFVDLLYFWALYLHGPIWCARWALCRRQRFCRIWDTGGPSLKAAKAQMKWDGKMEMYLTQPRILWTLLRRRRKKAFGSLFGLGLRSRPKEKVLFRGSFRPISVACCIFSNLFYTKGIFLRIIPFSKCTFTYVHTVKVSILFQSLIVIYGRTWGIWDLSSSR